MTLSAQEILRTAAAAIEQRSPERDDEAGGKTMRKAVAIFAAAEGVKLTESQGWQFMTCVKMARASQGNFQLDDFVDLAAYAALAGEAACPDD